MPLMACTDGWDFPTVCREDFFFQVQWKTLSEHVLKNFCLIICLMMQIYFTYNECFLLFVFSQLRRGF